MLNNIIEYLKKHSLSLAIMGIIIILFNIFLPHRIETAKAETFEQPYYYNYDGMFGGLYYNGTIYNVTFPFTYYIDDSTTNGRLISVDSNGDSQRVTIGSFTNMNAWYHIGGSATMSTNYIYVAETVGAEKPYAQASGGSALSVRPLFFVVCDQPNLNKVDFNQTPSVTLYYDRADSFNRNLFSPIPNTSDTNALVKIISFKFVNTDNTTYTHFAIVTVVRVNSNVTAFNGASFPLSSSRNYNDAYNQGIEFEKNIVDEESLSYKVGYDAGKAYGVAHANDYSFFNLFLSIFDAPLTVLQQALNFDLLGINIANFVLGLLGLALTLFIVRLVMGGLK